MNRRYEIEINDLDVMLIKNQISNLMNTIMAVVKSKNLDNGIVEAVLFYELILRTVATVSEISTQLIQTIMKMSIGEGEGS